MKAPSVRRPTSNSPKKPKNRRRNPTPSHPWLFLEIWLKILAHVALCVASIVAISKLLPYQQVQQAKLEEVRLAASEKEERVNQLRNQFSRSFDPSQTRQVMGEQSSRQDPNQRRILWTTR